MDAELQALLLDIFRKADFAINEPTYVEDISDALDYFEEIRGAILAYVEKHGITFEVAETEEVVQYTMVYKPVKTDV